MYSYENDDNISPKSSIDSIMSQADEEMRLFEAPRPERPVIYGQGGLDYLSDLVDDDIRDYLLEQIEESVIDEVTKTKLERLVKTYTSKDYTVTNYADAISLLKRHFEFRQDLAIIKMYTPGINYTYGDFNNLTSLLESHFNNKVTRSMRGFERVNQITQNVNSSYVEKLERRLAETKSGIAALFSGGKR